MFFSSHSRSFSIWLCALAVTVAGVRGQGTVSPFVSGAWSGNVTSSSATVCVRLVEAGLRVRLAVSASEQLTAPVFSVGQTTGAGTGNTVKLDIRGLQPSTTYYYGVEVDGVVRTEATSRGRFRTFPLGAGSFKIALIGDTDYREPEHRGAEAVIAEQPLLLLYNGDLHYSDLTSTTPEDFRIPYDNTLKHSVLGAMLRSAPIAYMWDDHDFAGGNDSDGTAAGSLATRTVYREYVPHYPLQVGDNTVGQAFTIGRVRVIMTDLRTAQVPAILPESATKTRMGAAQKAWFKRELIDARDTGYPLILWVCTVPWIAPATVGDDTWGGYATERAEIADFIKENRIRNLVVYGGDMHALAYDDGTHSDYATGGGAPLYVLHAAPLARDFNVKGGPYSAGPYLARMQYGILDIIDNGGASIVCRFTGKRIDEGAKFMFQFTASANAVDPRIQPTAENSADRALINISARSRLATPGDSFIIGFVVGGRSQRTILLRSVGPSLSAFGVTDALARPSMILQRGNTVVATNDDWGLSGADRLNAAFDRAGAFRYASATSRDAAIFMPLEPGAYTLQTVSANGGTGMVLVEVYEVP
ncbi:MAG: alkaline phosphatase D family protein [Verrucomicrobia bacterium]|nr:alkaline phosphatase D family protein [Verrucomicrobiota bacterium]